MTDDHSEAIEMVDGSLMAMIGVVYYDEDGKQVAETRLFDFDDVDYEYFVNWTVKLGSEFGSSAERVRERLEGEATDD